MHDPGGVSVTQGACNVPENADAFGNRKCAPDSQACAECLAFHARHREVRQSLRVAGGQKRNDVRLLELCRQLYLALEALGADARRKIRRKDFYDDPSAETILGGQEYPGHAAAAELAVDGVR